MRTLRLGAKAHLCTSLVYASNSEIDENQWGRMCAEHALPLGWERMEYDEFLRQRRVENGRAYPCCVPKARR